MTNVLLLLLLLLLLLVVVAAAGIVVDIAVDIVVDIVVGVVGVVDAVALKSLLFLVLALLFFVFVFFVRPWCSGSSFARSRFAVVLFGWLARLLLDIVAAYWACVELQLRCVRARGCRVHTHPDFVGLKTSTFAHPSPSPSSSPSTRPKLPP